MSELLVWKLDEYSAVCRVDDERHKMRGGCRFYEKRAADAELDRLQAIVAKLPTTRDGGRVVPFVDRLWWRDLNGSVYEVDWINATMAAYGLGVDPKSHIEIGCCYSSLAAAEGAGE